jgi:hypothetical protein
VITFTVITVLRCGCWTGCLEGIIVKVAPGALRMPLAVREMLGVMEIFIVAATYILRSRADVMARAIA